MQFALWCKGYCPGYNISYNQNTGKVTINAVFDNETEVDKDDKLIKLLEEANNTTDIADEELSTIAAFIKIYYDERPVDYGVIYPNSEATITKNENAVLKIEYQSLLSKLIFPNLNLFNSESTE